VAKPCELDSFKIHETLLVKAFKAEACEVKACELAF